jgi:hypothetical protein
VALQPRTNQKKKYKKPPGESGGKGIGAWLSTLTVQLRDNWRENAHKNRTGGGLGAKGKLIEYLRDLGRLAASGLAADDQNLILVNHLVAICRGRFGVTAQPSSNE